MGQVVIPDRFIKRRAAEFVPVANLVGQHYWHRRRTGEVQQQTALGLSVRGAYEAVQWLAGNAPVPPGFFVARARTRYDLLDVLRITDLACNDEAGRWESVIKGSRSGALEHFDRRMAAGAREVYEWALGMRPEVAYLPLLDEDVRAAKDFYQSEQRRLARQRFDDATSPYAHLAGALGRSVTEFEQAVRGIELAYTREHRDTPLAPACLGALKVGHWILGETGHPISGQRIAATRETIAAALSEVAAASFGPSRTIDRGEATAMVDMLHYALGQADEPPIRWHGSRAA